MIIETLDENQYSYFYVLNLFLKLTRPDPTWLNQVRWNIAQLLNATHLLVYIYIYIKHVTQYTFCDNYP